MLVGIASAGLQCTIVWVEKKMSVPLYSFHWTAQLFLI